MDFPRLCNELNVGRRTLISGRKCQRIILYMHKMLVLYVAPTMPTVSIHWHRLVAGGSSGKFCQIRHVRGEKSQNLSFTDVSHVSDFFVRMSIWTGASLTDAV